MQTLIEKLAEAMALDPGDKVALCFKTAPITGNPQTGEMMWNFTAVTYKGCCEDYILVDTAQGREAIPFDQLLRIAKLSDIAIAQPKVKLS